jgi:hypothetical protein
MSYTCARRVRGYNKFVNASINNGIDQVMKNHWKRRRGYCAKKKGRKEGKRKDEKIEKAWTKIISGNSLRFINLIF